MKTKFKRIGKQSVSVILAVMMMVSTMLVGMVTSNAAEFTGDYLYIDLTKCDSSITLKGINLYSSKSDTDDKWINTFKTVEDRIYKFYVADYVTDKKKRFQKVQIGLESKNGIPKEVVDATYNCLQVNSTGDGAEWTTYGGSTPTNTHNVTVTFSDATVTLDGKSVTSGTPIPVTNDAEHTLKVTPKDGYLLRSVNDDSSELVGTDGIYTLPESSENVNITVTTDADYSKWILYNKFNGDSWDTTRQFTSSEGKIVRTTYKFDSALDRTVPFLILNGSNYYKSNTTITEENCTDISLSTNADDIKLTVSKAGEYTFIVDTSTKKLTVEYPSSTKYSVTIAEGITGGTVSTSATSLAAGEPFTVTAIPNNDYELYTITVTDAEGNTVEATDASTHTYTMPASDVTVSATFKEKEVTKYSVTYTDPTGSEGVVSASIVPTVTTLAAGTDVTVTVTVNDGYTVSLAVADVDVTTSKSGNTYTFKFTMPANAITVAPKVTKAGEATGTEIQDLYLIYGNTSNDPSTYKMHTKLYVDSSNQVFAYFKKGDNLDTTKQYYFLISTSTGEGSYQNAYNDNKNYAFNDTKYNDVVNTDKQVFNIGSTAYYAGTFTIKEGYRDTISSVKINLGYYKDGNIQESAEDTANAYSYEVIPISGVEGMVQVFAKDGTIRANYQKYAYMADTVLENGADLTNYTHHDEENIYYESAYAKVGTKLKIKTIILPEYRDTYFVKAFSINGYSYGIIDASQAKKQNGVYTCEYTIPEDFEGSRIEITPIYYYIDDTDTVTFYVEGFDAKVQAKWGNTIAVHAWYTNGTETNESGKIENALGGYPGQPLVCEGGKYSMQVPKFLDNNTKNPVQGITLNNYIWDEIHSYGLNDEAKKPKNAQTYDFRDFVVLANKTDVDNIIFDFRYRSTDPVDETNPDNDPQEYLNSSKKGPTEHLKDYYGNIVDIFGTKISDSWQDSYDNDCLTVISNGYVDAGFSGGKNYATEWSVYDTTENGSGKRIATINCAELLAASADRLNDMEKYQDDYNALQQYKNKPVKIAYEQSIASNGNGGQYGDRADGRWYYSKNADQITSKVVIEYKSGDKFVTDKCDPGTNVGPETGAKAYFTNIGHDGDTSCTGTVGGGKFSVKAEADSNAEYYFIGWYLKTLTGSYTPVSDQAVCDIPMTGNDTYVARFIPTPKGTLTLSHKPLPGSPDGRTFIEAKIVSDDGRTVVKTFDERQGNIVITEEYVKYPSVYKLRITLKTVPYGMDTVTGFYDSNKNPYNAQLSGAGEQSYTIADIDINTLFSPPDASNTPELTTKYLTYYSNIESKLVPYTITYKYRARFDREDQLSSYVINDTVSGKELEEMWDANLAANLNKDQLSKEFITRKAPFVSNFGQEITWDITHANINEYTAIVEAKTTPSKVKILALTNDVWEPKFHEITYGKLATKDNGEYLYKTDTEDFPARKEINGNPYAFSFWAIFDKIEDANTFNDEVENYMKGENVAQNMKDRLTAIIGLDSYKPLIAKSYSKEFNYICYQDYFIVPVYAGEFKQSDIQEAQATIRLLEYTRNQWTDKVHGVNGNGKVNEDGTKYDYLYTDFALSFDKNQLLIQTSDTIKVGIAFEIVDQYDKTKGSDLTQYVTESKKDEIENLIKSNVTDGKVGTTPTYNRSVYRYQITNADISNKNRIEYYLRFKNTEKAQQHVMKVYSYIYDTEAQVVYLSDPEYMNLYDIGTLTYITSNLANASIDSGSAQ